MMMYRLISDEAEKKSSFAFFRGFFPHFSGLMFSSLFSGKAGRNRPFFLGPIWSFFGRSYMQGGGHAKKGSG